MYGKTQRVTVRVAPSAFLGADTNRPGAEAHYVMFSCLRSSDGEKGKKLLARNRRRFRWLAP